MPKSRPNEVQIVSSFGKTWTLVGANGTAGGAITGITFTGMTSTFANFQVTDSSYASYALGVVDGSAPRWSVFLLDGSSGTVSMTGGGFGHFALYGSNTGATQTNQNLETAPEPASLLLLGTGLGIVGQRLRRYRQRASQQVT